MKTLIMTKAFDHLRQELGRSCMTRALFFIFIILFNINIDVAIAQKVNVSNCDSIYSYHDSLVVLPTFKDGFISFWRFNEKVATPAPVISGRISAKAKVFLKCGIDKEGCAFNPSVIKIARTYFDLKYDEIHHKRDENWSDNIDLDYCEKEARRILNLTEFIPAKVNDTNVCFEGFVILINVYYSAGGYD